jgi:hypothetical protein
VWRVPVIIIIFAECFQIDTVLRQMNPMHILITSCCLTRLLVNCHLRSMFEFPIWLFPQTVTTQGFLYLSIAIFYPQFLCAEQYSSFGPQLYFPSNISCRKVSTEFHRIPPTRFYERLHFMHFTQKARNGYNNESVTVMRSVLHICIFSC